VVRWGANHPRASQLLTDRPKSVRGLTKTAQKQPRKALKPGFTPKKELARLSLME
jgi:hypothetical protein